MKVYFTTTKSPSENVKEYVIMPSGDIVCMTEEGESFWFDKNGKHPKSYLNPLPPQNKNWAAQIQEVREEMEKSRPDREYSELIERDIFTSDLDEGFNDGISFGLAVLNKKFPI
mgnify:CR=1 FL=1